MFLKIRPLICTAVLLCSFIQGEIFYLQNGISVSAADESAEKSFMYGDINGDGDADLTDLTLLSIFLMGGAELDDVQKKAADVDGNDENDIRDLAHMKRYVCKDNVILGPQNVPKEDKGLVLTQLSGCRELYDHVISNPESMVLDNIVYPEFTGDYFLGYYSFLTRSFNAFLVEENTVKEVSEIQRPANTITDGDVRYSFEGLNAYHVDGDALLVENADGSSSAEKIFTTIKFDDFPAGKPVTVLPLAMQPSGDCIFVVGIIQLRYSDYSFVSVYRKGDAQTKPELIDTYFQEGHIREYFITPDNCLYIVTNTAFTEGSFGFGSLHSRRYDLTGDPDYFKDQPLYPEHIIPEYTEEYAKGLLPMTGNNYDLKNVNTENVYLRSGKENAFANACTVISSIDINNTDKVYVRDTKVISGYTGVVYANAKNIYLSNTHYSIEGDVSFSEEKICPDRTDIIKVSISNGEISPQAACSVQGILHRKPSMKEIDGNLVVLTSSVYYKIPDEREEYVLTNFFERAGTENNLFILDRDLKPVTAPVIFSGNGVIDSVAFDNTDIFVYSDNKTCYHSIDISDPAAPVIIAVEDKKKEDDAVDDEKTVSG